MAPNPLNMTIRSIAQIGIDTPVRTLFDYLVPASIPTITPGMRVRVPFGKRSVIGLVARVTDSSLVDTHRLKSIIETLDHAPLLDEPVLTLLEWAADYYQYPPGAALFAALPPLLRKAKTRAEISPETPDFLWLSKKNLDVDLGRAPKQLAIFQWLQDFPQGTGHSELQQMFPNSRSAILGLEKRGLIQRVPVSAADNQSNSPTKLGTTLHLTKDQNQVSEKLTSALSGFGVHLLEGVTGSGKTEVYFNVIEQILKQSGGQGQILILVPEIGLTPQLLNRLQTHFSIPIGLLHSNVGEKERKNTWLRISSGELKIVLGTRLSVFTPMPSLQLIIVDEEHDASLKQQEGFLYHARDVAIFRAQHLNIPIILGSATPSFESLQNVNLNKFKHYALASRIHSVAMPDMQIVDMRTERSSTILSTRLQRAMHTHLSKNGQVILFLNRRGYAPVLICHDCGWVARCTRCDANMTFHALKGKLICHHCDRTIEKPKLCANCGSTNLLPVGHGTQRIEEDLSQQFPEYSLVRLDRDVARRKGNLEKILTGIQEHKHQIIVGTQMLSKGHDFPGVSLVGVLDVDYGIFSADYRALERTAQLLIQVAGRSGRRKIQGEVYVQTHAPDHPLLNTLLASGYPAFAKHALALRKEWNLPPYTYQVALRANSQQMDDVFTFLQHTKDLANQMLSDNIQVAGPVSPTMEKKAGQYRAYILLTAAKRNFFGKHLSPWLDKLGKLPSARRVRWNIDVDPIEGV